MIKIEKKVWIPILLDIKDALVDSDVDEAYDLLYRLADPLYTKLFPWLEWKKYADKEAKKDDKKSNL